MSSSFIKPALCRLCINTSSSSRTVFHLQLRQSRNVVLPGKFAHCYAQGDTVAFVTRQGHVVVWGWSDSAYELGIDHEQHFHTADGWESDLGGVPGIMFHPTDTDIVYAAWLHSALQPGKRPPFSTF